MKTLTDVDTGRSLLVTSEEGEDVISSTRTSLGDHRKIRREGTTVGITSKLLVGVWAGELVRELSGAVKVLSLIVGTVLNLVERSNGLGVLLSMGNTDEVTESNQLLKIVLRKQPIDGEWVRSSAEREEREREYRRKWKMGDKLKKMNKTLQCKKCIPCCGTESRSDGTPRNHDAD